MNAAVWNPNASAAWAPSRVLLLHGLGGTCIHWELVGHRIARRLNATVIAVDLAGFGLTRATPATATFAANVALVVELLERIGPASLVGNSMGGAIAIAVAAGRPDLVERLILVGPVLPQPPWPEPPYPVLPHNWPVALPGVGEAGVLAYSRLNSAERIVEDRLLRSFFDMRRVDPRIRARMVDLVRVRRAFAEAPYTYAAATRTLFAYATAPDGSARDVARVRCPTRIVHGAEDRLIPLALAEATLRRRPDWTLSVIGSCGHMPQLETPSRFMEAAFPDRPPMPSPGRRHRART